MLSGIKRPAAAVFKHVFEYSIPGLRPRDYEHTAEQSQHRIGHLRKQLRLNFLVPAEWRRCAMTLCSQILGAGGSVASLSLSGVKLLLLVLDPERTGG